MGRDWGKSDFNQSWNKPVTKTLVDVISPLPPRAKQAMYAAASSGTIKRHSWNGCAWNAAGTQVTGDTRAVESTLQAAQIFDCGQIVVRDFINVWDGLSGSDTHCTELLKKALLEVGLQTEPVFSKPEKTVRVVESFLHKSEETVFQEKFNSIVADLDLDDIENELVQDVHEVSNFLNATEREDVLLG